MRKMVQHKGLKFKALYFVEGKATFRGYKYRPDGTVFVVKEGSVLEDVVIPRGLDGVLDLGWVKLVEPKVPEDWLSVWSYEEYLKEWDLPMFQMEEKKVEAIWLMTFKSKVYLVVSERSWENKWKEVEELLLSTDIAR
ncbi:hypothetical protein [Thermocrinis sp.]|jgi:hypothetical protein|uniref:hypothetical protein n=1 Tax=Thermocrinis sp. TaxID=2024383 RepID=UPI003C0EDDE1